jgi:serine/threonine protein kinase
MLEFNCSSCGRRLSLHDAWAGKKCRCGHCGQVVAAPPASLTIGGPPSGSNPPAAIPLLAERSGVRKGVAAPESVIDEPTIPPEEAVSSVNGARPSASQPAPPAAVPAVEEAELVDFLAPPQGPDEIGRLGEYRILKVLGGGGMGVVFQAEDVRLGRMVALKTLLPALAASGSARERFLREARAAAAIEHDHIVTIYQVGEDRGIPFIAMQLLRGESLETWLQRVGRLGIAEVQCIARETLIGLAVAHERGLIHRDIKPSNIWLEVREEAAVGSLGADPVLSVADATVRRVKILDFGLARSLAVESNLTRTGTILGTPAYMAPEQARGRQVDARADLFSLGCVLYRACTGQPPFRGADAIATLIAVAEETPPAPHEVHRHVPLRFSQFIMALLAKNPAGRPASARAVLQMLQGLDTDTLPNWAGDSRPTYPQAVPVRAAPSTAEAPRRSSAESRTIVQDDEPAGAAGRKWLLIASVAGIVVGMVLLLILGSVALFLWYRSAEPALTATTEANRPDAPSALDPELQNLLREDLLHVNYTKTNYVGFPFAPEFMEVQPEGAVLIGFEFGIGRWEPNDVINSIRAIYLSEKGESFGKVHGKPTDRLVTRKAKKGYAVGSLRIVAHLQIDGIRVTFMRLQGKHLDADQSYSETAGTIGDKPTDSTPLGSGSLILGICGRDDGRVCNALGLVLRGKVDK